MDPYKQLKALLLQPEQDRLNALEAELQRVKERLEDKQRLLETLKPVISESISEKIRDSREEMAEALAPVMGAAIKKQIADARDEVVDALYPVIGQTIRKSIAEAMKKLVASINQRLDQAFSLRQLRLKIQARFTGVPYEELVLRQALPFRIREIYVIHKDSGLLIARIQSEETTRGPDDVIISGMLTAIRDFAREAFSGEISRELNQITYDDLEIYLENSRYMYLAFVTEGVAPETFTARVHELENQLHRKFHDYFRQFQGEGNAPEELTALLQQFIHTLNEVPSPVNPPRRLSSKKMAFAVVSFLFVAIAGSIWLPTRWQNYQLRQKIRQLTQSGVLNDASVVYEVSGGQVIVRGSVENWKTYHHLIQTLQQALAPATIQDELQVVPSPRELQTYKAELLKKVPPDGQYDAESLHLLVHNGVLILEGAVSDSLTGMTLARHLAQISGAPIIVNATEVNAFSLLQQFVKTIRIYFDFNSSTLTATARQQLDWLARQLLQVPFRQLMILGFADSLGTPEQNQKMAQRRAFAVREYLQQQGVPAAKMISQINQPVPADAREPAQARRVEFRLQ